MTQNIVTKFVGKPAQEFDFGFNGIRSAANFMVAIAYGTDAIAAEKYNGRRNAGKFFSIALEHFVHIFRKYETNGEFFPASW